MDYTCLDDGPILEFPTDAASTHYHPLLYSLPDTCFMPKSENVEMCLRREYLPTRDYRSNCYLSRF